MASFRPILLRTIYVRYIVATGGFGPLYWRYLGGYAIAFEGTFLRDTNYLSADIGSRAMARLDVAESVNSDGRDDSDAVGFRIYAGVTDALGISFGHHNFSVVGCLGFLSCQRRDL